MKMMFAAYLGIVGLPLLASCAPKSVGMPVMGVSKSVEAPAPYTAASQFALRTIHAPPSKKLVDAAEAYVAVTLPHPSRVHFRGEFETTGKTVAICGYVSHMNKERAYTPYRPYYVEFVSQSTTRSATTPLDPDHAFQLTSLCGNMPDTN